MSIKRKALRNENRNLKNRKTSVSLKQKLLNYSLALGFAFLPWNMPAAYAEIARVDGGVTETNAAGNVHNIYAGQVDGANAVNRFNKFDLPANQIANMYFKTKGGTSEASNLYNFVNARINIDGTVNAIRSNTIGGHMYFLSKDGLTLGANGVINAGALTIMNGVSFPGTNSKGFDKIANLNKLQQDQGSGSIEIKGKINAVDLVNIVSNNRTDVKNGAKINTVLTGGKKNFTKLVNIGAVNSGITGNLEVARSSGSNGNVAIIARATDYNEDSKAIQKWMNTITKNTVGAHVTVEQNAAIKAAGEASVGAYADNTSKFGNLASFGNIGQTHASVDINGTIEGDTVNIISSATNKFTKGAIEKGVIAARHFALNFLEEKLFGADVVGLEVDVVGLKADSTLNVGATAKLTATGKDVYKDNELVRSALNLQSTADVIVEEAASGNKTSDKEKYFGLGLLVSRLENDANLKIEGGAVLKTTDAAGSIAAKASATTKTDLKALAKSDNSKQDKTAYVTSAVNVSSGYTHSLVDIAKGANLVSAKDVAVAAKTSVSSVDWAAITNAQDVKISTSVVFVDLESDAKVNMNGTVNAGNNISINAANTDKLAVKSSNNTTEDGAATWVGYLADPGADFTGLTNTIITFIKNKFILGENEQITAPVFKSNGWTAGASIGVAMLKNEANINIGNNASLNAGKDIKIKAQQNYADILFSTTGSASVKSSAEQKENVISSAIGYLKRDDAANVTIAGGEGNNVAKLTAGNNIDISADAEYTWDRYNNMVNSVKAKWDKITLKNFRDNVKAGKKVPDQVEVYYANPTAENFEKLQLAIAKDPGFFDFIGEGISAFLNIGGIVREAEKFANAATYVNVNVGASSRPKTKNVNDVSVAVAGVVTNYSSKSDVVVGRNAELTAGNKIDVTAKAKQVDANYYGMTQGIIGTYGADMKIPESVRNVLKNFEVDLKVLPGWSTSKGDVYGGNVGIAINDIQSGVIVAEGAKLTAKDISLNSDTDMQRVLVALGGGAAGDTGVTGMITVNTGKTNSIVSVDNEANITATGANGLVLKADNDALLVNVDGDITVSSSTAVGASIGFTKNEFITAAAIHDNDKANIEAKLADYKNRKDKLTTVEKDDQLILGTISGLLSDAQKNYLGNADLKDTAINVSRLSITSTSTPEVVTIGVAGSVSKKEPPKENVANGVQVIDGVEMRELEDMQADDEADDNQNDVLNEINEHVDGGKRSGKDYRFSDTKKLIEYGFDFKAN